MFIEHILSVLFVLGSEYTREDRSIVQVRQGSGLKFTFDWGMGTEINKHTANTIIADNYEWPKLKISCYMN